MHVRPSSALLTLALVGSLVFAAVPAGAQSPTTTSRGSVPGTATPRPPQLSTPVLSARRVPDLLRSNIADERLRAAVETATKDAPPTSCIEVTLRGRVIYRLNGDTPLEPASANKMLIAVALLQHFKADDKLVTATVAQTPPENGVVKGNLWLVGGGDGMLTTPGYKQSFIELEQTVTPFGDLADRIKAAGITEIQGDIVGDESRYDTQRYIPSWPERYKRSDTVGPLSALTVNDGVTGYTKDPDAASKTRQPGDPPVLAAETLKSYLEKRGIKVTGAATSGKAPAGTEVARIETTIGDEILEMLSFSDNTTAELLTKELGLKASGSGTTAAGIKATIDALAKLGLPTTGVVMTDGSGLDEGNRLTCDLLNTLLDKHGIESPLGQGMSIWGERGTLRKRTKGTGLQGNVWAKTGTLTNPPVASLAGWVKTRAGEVVTFSFVQNGMKIDANLQDQLALALLEYPQAPSLTEIGPRQPTAT